MSEYCVYLSGMAETHVYVEAEDAEEAIEEALEDAPPFICHKCAEKIDFGEEWSPTGVFDQASGDMVWRREP